ncbi:MAG TPA: hypothetical protein VGR20_20145 [Acidimicrobiia bacterium]|nr:hypothetical protein [Acidimicrobiia bacterium]
MSVSAGTEWRRVTIHTLVRQCDDVVVELHRLGERPDDGAGEEALSGHSGARNFALLAHWAGAETPLRFISHTSDAVLMDGEGSIVHLDLGAMGADEPAR